LFAEAGGEKKAAAKGGKGGGEKLFNTGAVYGTGVARKMNITTNKRTNQGRAVPLKGGRGRKKLKIMKKHIDIAKRKKQQRKLQGKVTGMPSGIDSISRTIFHVMSPEARVIASFPIFRFWIQAVLVLTRSICTSCCRSCRTTASACESTAPTLRATLSRATTPSSRSHRRRYGSLVSCHAEWELFHLLRFYVNL
jgi:hypothetical protein